jgi:hypothetical protein
MPAMKKKKGKIAPAFENYFKFQTREMFQGA